MPRSQLRNRLEYWAVRGLMGALEAAPSRLAEPLSSVYARTLDAAVPRFRRIAMRNLELAMPALDEVQRAEIVKGVFRSIAGVLLALAKFPEMRRDKLRKWIRLEGLEHIQAAEREGKGILFATGHAGNWELSAFAYGRLRQPMHVVVRPLDNPLIEAWLTRRRGLSGNVIHSKRGLARHILRALAANQAVGVLVDHNTAADEGVFVPFFGIPACSATGFAKLAARSGAAVIPGFALWSNAERKYVLRFYPPVPISGDAVEDTRRIQARLEAVIRVHPDQWLWIHRRWKTRPAGEGPLY